MLTIPQRTRIYTSIGIAAVACLLSFYGGRCSVVCPSVVAASIKADTVEVIKVIEHEPVYIKSKAVVHLDTITHKDTIYQTPAFVATLDTIVRRDTMSLTYRYPEQEFSLALKQGADSIKTERITLTITNTVLEKRPLLLDILTHVGAASIGYALAQIK